MRRRLALLAAAVTSAVVLAFCLPLAFVVRTLAYDRGLNAAELQARTLAVVLATVNNPNTIADIVASADVSTSNPATVYLPQGQIIGPGGPPPPGQLSLARQGKAYTAVSADGGREVWVPVRGPSGQVTVVRVSVGSATLQKGVARSWLILGTSGVLLVLVAVGLADTLARSIVKPMERLRVVTDRLSSGDLDARAIPAGPPEVADVARAVNLLADRILELLAAERESVADLGHRLRTPLTAVRLDAENLTNPHERDRLAVDVKTLESAVNQLIQDVRHSRPAPSAEIELGAAIRSRMTFWQVLARAQRRPVTVDLPDRPVPVRVRADEFEAAFDALLGNVFTHTAEGTAFAVRLVEAGGGPAAWVVTIEDQGPGLPTGHLRRGMSSGSGTGLGLDIARQSMERAGGTFRISPGVGGRGVRVELGFRVPVARARS